MTIAICLKCGGIKFGALTACHRCGLGPETRAELAQSIALTDRQYSIDELKQIGTEIAKSGKIPVLPERKQKELLAAVHGSPYLEMILNSSAAENRAVQIRHELGETFEEIKFLPIIVFNLIAGADGRIKGRAKKKFAEITNFPQVDGPFHSDLMKALIHFCDNGRIPIENSSKRLSLAEFKRCISIIQKSVPACHIDGFVDDMKEFILVFANLSGSWWGLLNGTSKREALIVNTLLAELGDRIA
jgi:hypothetical protein